MKPKDMLIVFPICCVDIDLFSNLVDQLIYFNKKIDTKALIIFKVINQKIDTNKISVIQNKLKNLFTSLTTIYCEEPKKLSWCLSVSNTFTNIIKYLKHVGNIDPFYIMEADNTILKPEWYELLRNEYFEDNHIFLGNIATINPYYQDRYGKITLVGGAIYPANVYEYIKDFADIDFNTNTVDEYFQGPFDLCISKDIISHSKQSRYMQNLWGSSKFQKISDTEYHCVKSEQIKNIQVNSETAIFHGCKDGSLWRCFYEKK